MLKSKGFSKELEAFCAEYEEEVQEMLVLTAEHVGGACSYVEGIWRPSAEFLASADLADGTVNREKGQLSWLAQEKDREGWIFKLKPFTIYRVKCRRRKEKKSGQESAVRMANEYMLVEVAGRGLRNEGLSQVLEEYKRPVFIEDELCGRFELERAYNWFCAEVPWLSDECRVSLGCDEEDGETADGALAAFREIYADAAGWDKKFRAFAAEELTELANDWQDTDDYDDEGDTGEDDASGGDCSAPVTKAAFAKRIAIREFSINAEGDYTAYYDDDDMFYGHVIMIEGNIRDGMDRADIAG